MMEGPYVAFEIRIASSTYMSAHDDLVFEEATVEGSPDSALAKRIFAEFESDSFNRFGGCPSLLG